MFQKIVLLAAVCIAFFTVLPAKASGEGELPPPPAEPCQITERKYGYWSDRVSVSELGEYQVRSNICHQYGGYENRIGLRPSMIGDNNGKIEVISVMLYLNGQRVCVDVPVAEWCYLDFPPGQTITAVWTVRVVGGIPTEPGGYEDNHFFGILAYSFIYRIGLSTHAKIALVTPE